MATTITISKEENEQNGIRNSKRFSFFILSLCAAKSFEYTKQKL